MPKKDNYYSFNITISEQNKQVENLQMGSAYLYAPNLDITIKGSLTESKAKEKYTKSQISKIIPYFKKQFKAIAIPLKDSHGVRKFLNTGAIYVILSFGIVIGRFFIRGWRLGVIDRIAKKNVVIAPTIITLTDIGKCISDGIMLIFIKILYDLPKILLLVIFGYELIEIGLNFFYWLFSAAFGAESRGYYTFFMEEDFYSLGTFFFIKILLFLAYSTVVTPTYKIMTIKYAFNRDWSIFFNKAEIKDSFAIYKKRPRATLAAYLWDVFVTTLGNLLSFILIFIPVLGIILNIFVRFIFIHWPKAHGYGMLARTLIDGKQIGSNDLIKI